MNPNWKYCNAVQFKTWGDKVISWNTHQPHTRHHHPPNHSPQTQNYMIESFSEKRLVVYNCRPRNSFWTLPQTQKRVHWIRLDWKNCFGVSIHRLITFVFCKRLHSDYDTVLSLWWVGGCVFQLITSGGAKVARNFSYSPATPSYAICSLPKLVRNYRKTSLLLLKIRFSCKICTVFFYITALKLTFS